MANWNEIEEGCHNTYDGGHHNAPEREAFHHGMSTVFNLLRAHFVCRSIAEDTTIPRPAKPPGRACWFRLNHATNFQIGAWQSWSQNHDEYEAGPGHWPCAIVEDKTGKIHVVFAGDVHFGSDPR